MTDSNTTACACEGQCNAAVWNELDEFIASHERGRNSLIQVLHKAQELFGYLPPDVHQHVADQLGLPVSEVLGVVTFYHYFSMQPRGRHTINVCMGTACYVRGAKKVLEALQEKLGIKMGETTPDRRFSITTQRCFGACGLAPVIMVNSDVHGRVTANKLTGILNQYE
ncbi:MAG: NADH-quinone oxidoreductase subunit NuoE [Kiritimatiellia bacterium]|nr:NADH-quinone oxidoreductase subunit NuoE [Lentisphaerota bacterium]